MRLRRISLLAATLVVSLAPAAHAQSGGTAPGASATGGSSPTGKPAAATPSPKPASQVKPGAGAADVPAKYLRLYRAAGRAKGIDWRILAAIGKSESDHGRSTAPGVASGLNFARCCAGPMQFCTVKSCGDTWKAHAVDGNGDGRKNVYDPADAILAAAALVTQIKAQVGSRTDFILASYNAGPAYVVKHRRLPPYLETRAYVRKSLAYIRQLG
jgi:membrane-bound lytic murein transglycosylase B